MKFYLFFVFAVTQFPLLSMDHATNQRLRARLAASNIEAMRNQVVQSLPTPLVVRFSEKMVWFIDRLKKPGN